MAQEPQLFHAIANFGKVLVGDDKRKKAGSGVVVAGGATAIGGIASGSLFFTLMGIVTAILGVLTRILGGKPTVIVPPAPQPANVPTDIVDELAAKHGKTPYQVDMILESHKLGIGDLSMQLKQELDNLESRKNQLNAREKGQLEVLQRVAALQGKKHMAGVS